MGYKHSNEPGIAWNICPTSSRQVVQNDDLRGMAPQKASDNMRADKPGVSGHKHSRFGKATIHAIAPCLSCYEHPAVV